MFKDIYEFIYILVCLHALLGVAALFIFLELKRNKQEKDYLACLSEHDKSVILSYKSAVSLSLRQKKDVKKEVNNEN